MGATKIVTPMGATKIIVTPMGATKIIVAPMGATKIIVAPMGATKMRYCINVLPKEKREKQVDERQC